ncbi:hypothetical protein L195_g044837 [Trifolium pratense]|uniref:Secreted protein n=1 Tax=Trifolium pratense TaxID=57577 RepID=A0A2K3MD54_TRIPR|nr:hypothetical protein L195_g044837 [Trifolium pratense]
MFSFNRRRRLLLLLELLIMYENLCEAVTGGGIELCCTQSVGLVRGGDRKKLAALFVQLGRSCQYRTAGGRIHSNSGYAVIQRTADKTYQLTVNFPAMYTLSADKNCTSV